MLHMYELARAVMADREREIRERLRGTAGMTSRRRVPSTPVSRPAADSPAARDAAPQGARRGRGAQPLTGTR
jgi:hypothetical protein